MEGFSTRRSSCLLFQMFGVETHSFLPDEQSDRGDLARQGQTRHRWFHPFGNESRVELVEGPIDTSGPNGCTLEDIFQIVVMIFVEPADGYDFLGALELATHHAVFPAVACFQRQAAVAPQLSLGAEAVRRLDEREQQSCTNRPDRGDLAQQFRGAMLPAFGQQTLPGLLVQRPQRVELLVVKFRPAAHTGFADFRQPFGPLKRCVHLLTSTRDGPASVDRLQASHHPREIFRDRQIAARQLLYGSYARLFVIDGPEKVRAQQLGEFPRIDAVALVADFQQRIPARIADQHLRDVGLEQVVQPGRAGAFFEGHMQTAAQTVDKLQKGCRFRFEDGLHHQLAGGIHNCRRDRCLMNIQPNILGIIHEGAPFRRR